MNARAAAAVRSPAAVEIGFSDLAGIEERGALGGALHQHRQVVFRQHHPDSAIDEALPLLVVLDPAHAHVLREKGTPYAELGLGDAKWSDDQLLDFIVQHPILMNRPVVVTPNAAKLCRPSETVLELLAADKP